MNTGSMSAKTACDVAVIGGGAAGLMAAGAACARGLTVTVLEHNPKGPGQKLLITGKGRCNVTSDSDVRELSLIHISEPTRH